MKPTERVAKAMSIVDVVMKKIQDLSPVQQQAVLEFTEFLEHKNHLKQVPQSEVSDEATKTDSKRVFRPQSHLGQKLYRLRLKAIEEGTQLLTADELDSEIATHRRYHTQYEDVSG